jgi:hypothetical protein
MKFLIPVAFLIFFSGCELFQGQAKQEQTKAGPMLTLVNPANQAKIVSENGINPTFQWSYQYVSQKPKFRLEIAEDESFKSPVFQKAELEPQGGQTNMNYRPPLKDVFLPSINRIYYWRVTGTTDAGEEIVSKDIRSFKIQDRKKIKASFKVHKDSGKTIKVKVGNEEEKMGDFNLELEVGEMRKVAITLIELNEIGKPVEKFIGGDMVVRTAPKNTDKDTAIVVDKITPENITHIVNGKVGNFSFELGGEVILTMKLGSRKIS